MLSNVTGQGVDTSQRMKNIMHFQTVMAHSAGGPTRHTLGIVSSGVLLQRVSGCMIPRRGKTTARGTGIKTQHGSQNLECHYTVCQAQP